MGDKRAQRRQAPIAAYIGPNGAGKSLAMVYDTIPSLQSGRPVLSTVRILDPDTGGPHPLYQRLTSWRQLLDFRGGDVLLDEVQGVASSRAHAGLPPAVLTLLLQLRRRDVVLRWSSPSYARADLVLREVTQAVTWCKGAFPERATSGGCLEGCDIEHEHEEATLRLWGANRVFYWRTYPASDYDDFSAGKRESRELKADVRQLYVRPRDPERADSWYDSLDAVDHIADVVETGVCITCGGSRRRPKCECPSHEEEAPRAREASTGPTSLPAAHVLRASS